MDDLLADFVAETREMLEASEGEIIAWEADPADRTRLDSIFRFVHTVKGNCGFFDFPRLERLSHAAEDTLSDVRAGRRQPDTALVSAVLAIIDRIAEMIDTIEAGNPLTDGDDQALIDALEAGEIDGPVAEPAQAVTSDAGPTKPAHASSAPRTIRLPVNLLDRVMSGVSDMVLARNDLAHRLRDAGTQPTIDGPFERLTTILTDVREAITRMRMQRIEHLFGSFPRLVRDLSGELGKQVLIDLEGGDVELDREMIEMIRDPLTHIIRNAVDHGIETPSVRLKAGKREMGVLSIAARQSGNQISIVITDDGRGLDEERIAEKAVANGLITEAERDNMSRADILQLVFEPGLSTATQVSAVSGRGVGLDVVRDNLEKVGGSIKVTSTPGVGSLFYLQLPLTLSIIAGLTVAVGDQSFAIPQSYVEEIIHADSDDIDYAQVGDIALVTFRGERTPCLSLARILGLPETGKAEDKTMVLLRLASGDLFAIAVDGINNHGDLVVKPVAPSVMACGIYSGSTLLDDGRPIMMLDVPALALENGLVSDTRARVLTSFESEQTAQDEDLPRAMLFTGFDGRRRAVRLELVQRIETVDAAALDLTGSEPRVVIDGAIYPLVGWEDDIEIPERIRMLRLSDGESELVFAVEAIEDAAVLENELVPIDDDPLIEATTLIDEAPVALIDGHALFARFGAASQPAERLRCRLPDDEWARTILAPLVTSAGYSACYQESEGADVTICMDDADAGADDGDTVIHLRSSPEIVKSAEARADTIYRYDRGALLEALRAARGRKAS